MPTRFPVSSMLFLLGPTRVFCSSSRLRSPRRRGQNAPRERSREQERVGIFRSANLTRGCQSCYAAVVFGNGDEPQGFRRPALGVLGLPC